MNVTSGGRAWGSFAIAILLFVTRGANAETSQFHPITAPLDQLATEQQMLELPVRVVDPDGKPVANAKVTPWALRSSQGHGRWAKDDEEAGVGPKEVVTDENGAASVLYPRFRDAQEGIRTLAVSLFVDHPDFAYVDSLHIDVPLLTAGPYEIKLEPAVPLEVRPLVDGQSAALDDIYALWSDGRSWQAGSAPEKTATGTLRIPAMRPGANSVFLVKLAGHRAAFFSKITDVELTAGEPKKIDVIMRPSLHVPGALSDNVPRPIQHGRVSLRTLPPKGGNGHRVEWISWAPIQSDGTFAIDGWPADEPLQIIALCDGYIATSGTAPAAVDQPPDPKTDSFGRPQVFESNGEDPITVEMTPLGKCEVTAVDEHDQPVVGVTLTSWPNVGWWNIGSQIYCAPLARGERILRDRDYESAVEKAYAAPFQADTDSQGKATLELPAGSQHLAIVSKVYEVPVFLGHRDMRVELTGGQTTEAVLRLQASGTEKLGEWDKLAGVVFGCSTREGRQICALPGVRKKMDEFTDRFREAKNQHDPQLLSEAYAAVADAFEGAGDQAEAAKWRQKAADEAEKAKSQPPESK